MFDMTIDARLGAGHLAYFVHSISEDLPQDALGENLVRAMAALRKQEADIDIAEVEWRIFFTKAPPESL